MNRVVRMAMLSCFGVLLVGSPVVACTSDAECDDGLFCNGMETCNLGTMLCDPGTPEPDFVICDDGVPCTLGETCQAGVCTGGSGADTDGDGDCDVEEAGCNCNPNDTQEVCPLPNRLVGRGGNHGGEVLMEFFTPTSKRMIVPTEPSCATTGVCGAEAFPGATRYCTVGKIRDVCTADAECDQPPDTCRVVVNYADRPDMALLFARMVFTDIPGFTPVTRGCSRKVDVQLDTLRPLSRLRLLVEGTVEGRLRKDRDTFRYKLE